MKKNKAEIFIASGGTAGHVFPAQVIAQQLSKKYHVECKMLTDERGEKFLQQKTTVFVIKAATFNSLKPLNLIRCAGAIIHGIAQSLMLIYRYKPRGLIIFGGYPSLPPAIAAIIMRIPIMLHEQNASMGRVNRFIAPCADTVFLSTEECRLLRAGIRKKSIVTGNPLREQFYLLKKKKISLNKTVKRKILIFAGSQGAKLFNQKIPTALASLSPIVRKNLTVIQQSQQSQQKYLEQLYQKNGIKNNIRNFIKNMAEELADADIVIARSGAGTVAELIALRCPAILIPLAASIEGDQYYNALQLARKNCAIIIKEAEIDKLAGTLEQLLATPIKLTQMSENYKELQKNDAVIKITEKIYQKMIKPAFYSKTNDIHNQIGG